MLREILDTLPVQLFMETRRERLRAKTARLCTEDSGVLSGYVRALHRDIEALVGILANC